MWRAENERFRAGIYSISNTAFSCSHFLLQSDLKLEKVALVPSSAVRLRRDGVTLNCDLLTQKRNQVICVLRCTSDKSLAKIYQ